MRTGPRAFVDGWLARRARTSSAPLLAQEALAAVWGRAQRSLSDPGLEVLARNALDTAAKEFALLADARIGPQGFDLGALAGASAADLLAALGGLLVEFLALVEDTSGAILAPALEAELLRVDGGKRTPVSGVRPVPAG